MSFYRKSENCIGHNSTSRLLTLSEGYTFCLYANKYNDIQFERVENQESKNWYIQFAADISENTSKEKRNEIIKGKIDRLYKEFFTDLRKVVFLFDASEGRMFNTNLTESIEEYSEELKTSIRVQNSPQTLDNSYNIETTIQAGKSVTIGDNSPYVINLTFEAEEFSCAIIIPYISHMRDKVDRVVASTLNDMLTSLSVLE